MREKVIKTINNLIEAGILLIVFSVPLYFSFFYQNFSLFSLDRAVLFQILVEILIILSLVKIVLSRKILIFTEKKYLILPILFFLSLALATIFSIDPHKSFWGSYFRQQGLFTYLHYFLFFSIIISYLKDGRKIERIINTILLSSFIVSVYGILQWFGIEFIDWLKNDFPQGRVVSTLGQPVFLGNYLLLVIFLTIYKIIINNKALYRSFFILLFILQFFCLTFTYSRGAWLGFVFGALASVFLYLFVKNKNLLKTIGSFLLVVIIILSLFISFNFTFSNSNESFFVSRIKSMVNFESGSLAMRFETWKASLAAISRSPLIGYGLENQHEVLVSFYNPNWSVYEDINISSDRAHNLILDLMLDGGIILLIIYITFFLFIFIKGVRYLTKDSSYGINWLLFSVIISIAAYHFSLLFSFSIIETNVLFWLYVAIIFVAINNYKEVVIIELNKKKRIYLALFIYATIIISGFLIYFLLYNINSIKADYYFKKARANYYNGNYIEMLANYDLALKLNNNEGQYKWFYTSDLIQTLNKIDSQKYINNVIYYLNKTISEDKISNNYFPGLLMKANVYTVLGKYKDKKYYNEAEKIYKELISISPFFPDSYRSWGQMYYLAEDYEKAILIYNEALSVLPDLNNFYLNRSHQDKINKFVVNIYEKIAECYLKLNDFNSQLNYYKEIILIDPYRLDIYKKIADIYYRQGDLEIAIWYNKRGYMLNPRDYAWPFAIALLYEENGDKEKALEYADKALELATDNDQVKKFINEINH